MAFPFTQIADFGRRALVALRQTGDYRYPAQPRVARDWKTVAGVVVTPDIAMKNAVVWACTRYISQAIASLPVKIMIPKALGNLAATQSAPIVHSIGDMLSLRPSEEWSPFRFRETMIRWALTWGNGYAEIEFDLAGRACALHPLHPERVLPLRDEDGKLFYRVYNGPGFTPSTWAWVDIPPERIFHLAGFGDGPIGVNVVEYAAQSIGWAAAAELFGASFFGEGMSLGGVVQMKGRAEGDTITRMRAELEGRHVKARGGRWLRWLFIDNDATVTKMSATPNEGQFVDTLNYQVAQICRWFGCPPHKVMDLTKGTFSNVEQQNIEVVGDCLMPWCIRFEEEATFKLFGQNRQGLFVKLDLKGLLRGDFASRQTGLAVMRANGVINADQWAELEDMIQPGAKVGGDKFLLENIWTPMETVGQPPPAPAAPHPTPATAPAAPAKTEEKPAEEPPEKGAALITLRTLETITELEMAA